MTRDERALRAAIVAKARWMNAAELNQGTSGNISARYKDVLLITPSATPYDAMTPEIDRRDAARRRVRFLDRAPESIDGMAISPRHHQDRDRTLGAIVHTHSTYATVLAIARKEIPACHYMIAAFGGADNSLRWLCPLRNARNSRTLP